MSLKASIEEKLTALASSEFTYIETPDIKRAEEIDYNCTGIYMEATIIYVQIKNIPFLLKENGRRKIAQIYTMFREVLAAVAESDGGFVNCYSPESFLVIYPGKETVMKNAVRGALKISSVLSESLKTHFGNLTGLEFGIGIDHGHIMGTKNLSDNGIECLTWFGSGIMKAKAISHECARPYYVGISSIVFHGLDEELLVTTKRILGIKKRVELWTKLSFQYENTKKHLYQTNHKIALDDAQ